MRLDCGFFWDAVIFFLFSSEVMHILHAIPDTNRHVMMACNFFVMPEKKLRYKCILSLWREKKAFTLTHKEDLGRVGGMWVSNSFKKKFFLLFCHKEWKKGWQQRFPLLQYHGNMSFWTLRVVEHFCQFQNTFWGAFLVHIYSLQILPSSEFIEYIQSKETC